MDFSEVEKSLGYTFKDKTLLKRALTLSSADNADNNERLEFFGDAILEFIVSEIIFDDGASEGQLTERRKALVADEALKPVSERLGLDNALIRGKNDLNNKKAIPSAYEAVIAAIYIDGGLNEAKRVVKSTLDFTVNLTRNYIGELQELLQKRGEVCPDYVHESIGTEQRPRHMAKITIYGRTFEGVADKYQDAKKQAAKAALNCIKTENL